MEQKAVCGGFYVGEGLEMDGKTLKATGGDVGTFGTNVGSTYITTVYRDGDEITEPDYGFCFPGIHEFSEFFENLTPGDNNIFPVLDFFPMYNSITGKYIGFANCAKFSVNDEHYLFLKCTGVSIDFESGETDFTSYPYPHGDGYGHDDFIAFAVSHENKLTGDYVTKYYDKFGNEIESPYN